MTAVRRYFRPTLNDLMGNSGGGCHAGWTEKAWSLRDHLAGIVVTIRRL